jgi:hypothetical protein
MGLLETTADLAKTTRGLILLAGIIIGVAVGLGVEWLHLP